ncbi:MAG: helix-turn-helix domain-containing protein [Deltaproteobacteria bacterium]|nr:helix-turn-helix domain-containing protein [Deltaproteobacteria bacterium]
MKSAKFESQILTVEEVAEFLKLSKITIYKLVKKGQIPGFRVGNSWRFRKDKILDIISKQTMGAGASTE